MPDTVKARVLAALEAAQAACPHVEWREIGWSLHSGDIGDTAPRGGTPRQLLQCPACGLMRWADEDVAVDRSRSIPDGSSHAR